MGNKQAGKVLGRLQVTGAKREALPELANRIHELHPRLGIPDTISFLDGGFHLSWSFEAPGLDRHEEIPMDAKFLYHLGRAARSRREIDLHGYGYELACKSPRGQVWTRVHDVASTRQEP